MRVDWSLSMTPTPSPPSIMRSMSSATRKLTSAQRRNPASSISSFCSSSSSLHAFSCCSSPSPPSSSPFSSSSSRSHLFLRSPSRPRQCSSLRHFSRYATPSRSAPSEAPPVIFKPRRATYDSIIDTQPNASSPPEDFDPQRALLEHWPNGFVPNLIRPLPWIVEPAPAPPTAELSGSSVRCGALAIKLGMMAFWNARGEREAVTCLQLDCQVVRVNPTLVRGTVGLVLGIGRQKLKKVSKAEMVQAKIAGVHPHRHYSEFRVTPDAMLPVTHDISARHFTVGQFVDCAATSTGFGFQGSMQRWNFGGQPASHGVSLTHRSHGATGSRQDPGRVFKGKKMAGRMGGTRITQLNLRVLRIDPVRNLLFVTGAVPGRQGAVVRVRDAIKKPYKNATPPFPTFVGDPGTETLVMTPEGNDPFAFGST